MSHSFFLLLTNVWNGCVISCLLSSAFHSFLNSWQIGFWPYLSAEIALLKVNSLHFVKCNGCFIHPNSHSIDTMFPLDCVRFCQAPTCLSISLGPLTLLLCFSLAPAPRSDSCCGDSGLKDSGSMVGLHVSLFAMSSMALCWRHVDFHPGKSEQAGAIQPWHKLRVGKICLGSGEEGPTPKHTLGECSSQLWSWLWSGCSDSKNQRKPGPDIRVVAHSQSSWF